MSTPEPPRPLRCPCCQQTIEEDCIRSDEQHGRIMALLELVAKDDPALGTPESDALLTLAVIVENYEKRRWPMATGS